MTEMIFFTKAGCRNSQQQKTELVNAGNTLRCKDILANCWTREKLLPFVRGREPLQIMDCRAEAISKGKIDPLLITWEEAISLMIDSPSLIQGPLIQVDNLYIQGKDDSRLNRYLNNDITVGNTPTPTKTQAVIRGTRKKWQMHQGRRPLLHRSIAGEAAVLRVAAG